ncbi:DUF3240 family protein [Halioxenophilus sp. WMMB6]|uniref:DUF3240 family protein n=1 Tax=Halioxenophilus sp. WMMB6 TaxID=3073815 RepID=UPI00295F3BFB|nr:DUF3240 family protein [Halioxenophilus sp. WMMB6]
MQQLLVLNIPPELEDELVDYLLAIPSAPGFTSYPVAGHGQHARLSLAEQVTGRRKRIQFELILATDDADEVVAGLRQQVGTDIYFWQQAVSNSGHL